MAAGPSSLSLEFTRRIENKQRSVETRIAAVRALRNSSTSEVCKTFKVARSSLFRWKLQWENERHLNRKNREHYANRILNDEEIQNLLNYFATNPGATNQQAAAFLNHRIHPRTISHYLKRANYSRKEFTDEQEAYLTEESKALVREYCAFIRTIDTNRRVYMDESFVYDNEAPRYGRSRKGAPIPRIRSRHGKRWTVYLAIREDGFVHPPILSNESADDINFYHYVWMHLAPRLRQGDVVIWDRLGRSGRCLNPNKQHYNPDARRLIEHKGAQVAFLPPKGKYFNPIELVFGLLKTHLRHRYTVSQACRDNRARTEQELRQDIEYASNRIGEIQLHGFFRERGTERAFRQFYPDILLD